MMPPTTNSPHAIALSRGIETTLLVIIATAIVTVLPQVQTQLGACSAQTPPVASGVSLNAYVACQFHWEPVFIGLLTALLTGLGNALTAFLSSVHNQNVAPAVTTHVPLTSDAPAGVSLDTKGPVIP